jgi:hypothetical protein
MRKEPVMKKVRCICLDVHADTIAVAVAEPGGEVRSLGVIPNRPESIRKLMKKLGSPASLRVCYEAGPTGYVIYWQLTVLGVPCEVVAPTLAFSRDLMVNDPYTFSAMTYWAVMMKHSAPADGALRSHATTVAEATAAERDIMERSSIVRMPLLERSRPHTAEPEYCREQ